MRFSFVQVALCRFADKDRVVLRQVTYPQKSLQHIGLSDFRNKAAILHKFACVIENACSLFRQKTTFLSGGFDRDTPYNLLCYVLITHVLVDGST